MHRLNGIDAFCCFLTSTSKDYSKIYSQIRAFIYVFNILLIRQPLRLQQDVLKICDLKNNKLTNNNFYNRGDAFTITI